MNVFCVVPAKKMLLIFTVITLLLRSTVFAIEASPDELLSLVNLTPATATQSKITSLLGQPAKVEETKKRTTWYYTHGNSQLVLSWNLKTELLEKFSFSSVTEKKPVFDKRLSARLKSGATDVLQALKILGVPKDMTMKKATQEMHYAYEHNVLRLFFRDRVLVDYCLY